MSANSAVEDPLDIVMWRRIDARLTTSGQPSEAQLAKLKEMGISHVVNLAPHTNDRALADEAASIAALGMTYVHIPVDFVDPADADFALFSAAMDELGAQTVHIHCAANFRVSAFLYRYRRDVLKHPDPDARAEMERIWRPGGKWAAFIGREADIGCAHRYAGRDY